MGSSYVTLFPSLLICLSNTWKTSFSLAIGCLQCEVNLKWLWSWLKHLACGRLCKYDRQDLSYKIFKHLISEKLCQHNAWVCQCLVWKEQENAIFLLKKPDVPSRCLFNLDHFGLSNQEAFNCIYQMQCMVKWHIIPLGPWFYIDNITSSYRTSKMSYRK